MQLSVPLRMTVKGPIGIAYGAHPIPDPKGAIATFRLMIGKTELPGRYKIDSRRFVRVDEQDGAVR
jgi:hypothetical protein